MLAIPTAAFKKVKKVKFDLQLDKQEAEKHADFLDNQFEIFLRDDFLHLYLRPNYEYMMKTNALGESPAKLLV